MVTMMLIMCMCIESVIEVDAGYVGTVNWGGL